MESIIVPCACGAKIKLPGTIKAGQRLRCPKCSGVVTVPESANPAEEEMRFEEVPASSASPTKSCHYCGETILATARKCKHCGEFVDPPDHAPELASAPSRRGGAKATAVISNDPNPAEYFTAILLAPVGFLIGLVWAARKLPKAKKMLQVAATMCVIYGVGAWLVWANFIKEGEGGPAAPVIADNMQQGPQILIIPQNGGDEEDTQPGPGPQNNGLPGGDINIAGQPPIIQKAMKANVRVDLDQGMGSGVVLQREGDEVLILTNQHVVDRIFALSRGQKSTPKNEIPKLKVTYFNGQTNQGVVTWVAPDGIDLAVIKVVAPKEIEPVAWHALPQVITGQDVFAVGNPLGLGWTYTRGVVSAVRTERFPRNEPKRDVPIIQTDTSITFGNSGGGLYASNGELIGINSSIVNPSLGKGLGFAIQMSVLLDLKPDGLNLPAPAAAKSP